MPGTRPGMTYERVDAYRRETIDWFAPLSDNPLAFPEKGRTP
jgi:hypothetical protein